MALTIVRRPYAAVNYTMRGQGKKVGYAGFNIGEFGGNPFPIDDAGVGAYLSEMGDNLEGISDAQVINLNVTYSYVVTGQAALGASPEVERKGVFQFNTADSFPAMVSVPALTNAALEPDGVNIKRTGTVFEGTLAAALQGVHDKLQNGMTANLITYPVVDRRGSDFNGLLDAYQQHRKNQRG